MYLIHWYFHAQVELDFFLKNNICGIDHTVWISTLLTQHLKHKWSNLALWRWSLFTNFRLIWNIKVLFWSGNTKDIPKKSSQKLNRLAENQTFKDIFNHDFSLSECNGTWIHSCLVCKWSLNYCVFVYKLSSCGFEYLSSLTFRQL